VSSCVTCVVWTEFDLRRDVEPTSLAPLDWTDGRLDSGVNARARAAKETVTTRWRAAKLAGGRDHRGTAIDERAEGHPPTATATTWPPAGKRTARRPADRSRAWATAVAIASTKLRSSEPKGRKPSPAAGVSPSGNAGDPGRGSAWAGLSHVSPRPSSVVTPVVRCGRGGGVGRGLPFSRRSQSADSGRRRAPHARWRPLVQRCYSTSKSLYVHREI
jgi:hypothetical protein